jgi:predicted pyridoxine 5'-phosphate oxidase superfamily flavin-nucleotide-binding protein
VKVLADEIVRFFRKQNFVVVSTIDKSGLPHSSCKGIAKIDQSGKVYLLDLYKAGTFENLRRSRKIAVTAVDEHRFKGYCLKGEARVIKEDKVSPRIIAAWEKRIAGRLAQRLLKNIGGKKGHLRHPEALLPKPEYLIAMQIKKVVDLTPQHLRDKEEG